MNPTPVNYVNWTTPETIPAGKTVSVPTPPNTFNCATRYYGNMYTLNGQIEYGYVEGGGGSVRPIYSDPITVLTSSNVASRMTNTLDIDWDDYE